MPERTSIEISLFANSYSGKHKDCRIHIESAFQLRDMKMTRHGLQHEDLTSAD